jgi:hypothetical protein
MMLFRYDVEQLEDNFMALYDLDHLENGDRLSLGYQIVFDHFISFFPKLIPLLRSLNQFFDFSVVDHFTLMLNNALSFLFIDHF